jgi:S1-C subfamily serine protease
VTDLQDGSYAASFGFRRGDVILEVNGERISRTADLEKATRNPARGWRISIERGGRKISAVLGG